MAERTSIRMNESNMENISKVRMNHVARKLYRENESLKLNINEIE